MVPVIKKIEGIDINNPREAVRQLRDHIFDLENQIEDLLMKIDNVNMLTIDLDDIKMVTDNGSEISGDKINIKGPEAQVFEVGYDRASKQFVFTMPQISKITADTIEATTIIRGGEIL